MRNEYFQRGEKLSPPHPQPSFLALAKKKCTYAVSYTLRAAAGGFQKVFLAPTRNWGSPPENRNLKRVRGESQVSSHQIQKGRTFGGGFWVGVDTGGKRRKILPLSPSAFPLFPPIFPGEGGGGAEIGLISAEGSVWGKTDLGANRGRREALFVGKSSSGNSFFLHTVRYLMKERMLLQQHICGSIHRKYFS